MVNAITNTESVRISTEILNKARTYARLKGMRISKVLEFAILDYLTKANAK